MTFDEDIDAIKQTLREWRYFYSLGPLTEIVQKPEKGLIRKLSEAFILYLTPFGLLHLAITGHPDQQ